jgi:MFS transporter, DHA2 family, multidrug resistance protein
MSWGIAEPLRRVGLARRERALPVAAAPPRPALPPPPAAPAAYRPPTVRDWVGVLAMVFGQFMAIMDVQIVTSSLTQIQGGLSASPDEIAWVQTAYLIADVVMMPLSGMLSRILSTRVVFCSATLGFTTASVLCATSTTLTQMILYRAMQGFCGGAIAPSVFPVVYTKFRPPQLATVMVFISLILNLSSTLGPTIGGYLTDTFSWHWLFLVNVVPGLSVTVIVWLTIDMDRPDYSLIRNFDVIGLLFMAVFLGCLEYALEEGPRWDWLDDDTIRLAVLVSGVAGALFFFRALTYRQPVVDLRAFLNRNFAVGSFYTFVIGTGLYGATYLIPLFLAQVRGFDALQIGETVVVTGIAQMLVSPFTAHVARKLDLRIMLAIGMAVFAVAMYWTAQLTNQENFWDLFWPQALRGFGLMFCYLPANLLALGTLPQDKLKNAAGLYNLTRDLGGAIILALIGTLMNDRLHYHWNRLIEDINPARPVVRHFLDVQTSRLGDMISGDPAHAAVALLGRIVGREALVLTYNDLLLMLGSIFAGALLLMPFVKTPRTALTAGPPKVGH